MEMVKLSRDISEADVEDSTPQQQSPAATGRGRKRGPKSKTARILKLNKPSPNKPLRHNEAVMACKMCPNTSFRGVNEFESHLAMEHFLAELLAEYGHKKTKSCELCGENFPTVQKLARHIGADHHKVMTFYETKVEELSEIIVSKYGLDNVQQLASCDIAPASNKFVFNNFANLPHVLCIDHFLIAELI